MIKVLTIFLSLSLTTSFAQPPAHNDSAWVRPPLKAGTVALQLVAGTVGGAAGFMGVMLPMALAGGGGGPHKAGGALAGIILGAGLGIPIGATMGVSAIGRTDTTNGMMLATGIGSLGGLFIFGTVTTELGLSPYFLPLATAAGATFMFNLTRHYRSKPAADL